MLLLETLEQRAPRGARIYAEVLGYGLNCDAHHPVAPDQDSVAAVHAAARMRNAGVKPGEVDLISAHGTGTKANDVTEAAAIREVFGDAPPPTVVDQVDDRPHHGRGQRAGRDRLRAGASTAGSSRRRSTTARPIRSAALDCVPNQARPADAAGRAEQRARLRRQQRDPDAAPSRDGA